MALRDANFLYSNTYRGMPCYVLSSYSAVYPGQTALAPAPLPGALQGPRNWDPTDPSYPGYSTPKPVVVVTKPTTTAPTEEVTEETSETVPTEPVETTPETEPIPTDTTEPATVDVTEQTTETTVETDSGG